MCDVSVDGVDSDLSNQVRTLVNTDRHYHLLRYRRLEVFVTNAVWHYSLRLQHLWFNFFLTLVRYQFFFTLHYIALRYMYFWHALEYVRWLIGCCYTEQMVSHRKRKLHSHQTKTHLLRWKSDMLVMFPVVEQFRRQFSANICIVTDRFQQRRFQTAAAQSHRSMFFVIVSTHA